MAIDGLTQEEFVIFRGLLRMESFSRKTIPFLKSEYFTSNAACKLFETINEFYTKYNTTPSDESILINLNSGKGLSEQEYHQIGETLENIRESTNELNESWLLDTCEKFCQERAIYNGIRESISILDGASKEKKSKEAIPEILKQALGVSFDGNIGHNYLNDYETRFEEYHKTIHRVAFSTDDFNDITKGGLAKKTLNIILAGTGVGKSFFMCDYAANALKMGKNVAYFTMEMSDVEISRRIDANLLNIPIQDIENLTYKDFEEKIKRLRSTTNGEIIVKEFPTASAHVGHFRHVLNELRLKKNFVPDVICVDYLNICNSSRVKTIGGSVNSYTFVKAIAEELRGLAVEFDAVLLTATQTNRDGFGDQDVELTGTSESFGTPQTADLMFALISNEDLEQMGQMIVKQLKNRYNDLNYKRKFIIGIDRTRMKIFNVDPSVQDSLSQDVSSTPDPHAPLSFKGKGAAHTKGKKISSFKFNSGATPLEEE